MSTFGAAAIWGPLGSAREPAPALLIPVDSVQNSLPPARLTRRGRLVRFLVVLGLVGAAAVLGVARLTSEPARADVAATAGPVTTASVVVAEGDSLWRIAQRQAPGEDPRDVVYQIRELNGMRSNLIHPGQVLLVPSVGVRGES